MSATVTGSNSNGALAPGGRMDAAAVKTAKRRSHLLGQMQVFSNRAAMGQPAAQSAQGSSPIFLNIILSISLLVIAASGHTPGECTALCAKSTGRIVVCQTSTSAGAG